MPLVIRRKAGDTFDIDDRFRVKVEEVRHREHVELSWIGMAQETSGNVTVPEDTCATIEDIEVCLLSTSRHGSARLLIKAPRAVTILRTEILDRPERHNRAA